MERKSELAVVTPIFTQESITQDFLNADSSMPALILSYAQRPEALPALLENDLSVRNLDDELIAEVRQKAEGAIAAGPLFGQKELRVWWQAKKGTRILEPQVRYL